MKLLGVIVLILPFIMLAITAYKFYRKTYTIASSVLVIIFGEIYSTICLFLALLFGIFSTILGWLDGVDGASVDVSREEGFAVLMFVMAFITMGIGAFGIVSLVRAIRDKKREARIRIVSGVDNGEIEDDIN